MALLMFCLCFLDCSSCGLPDYEANGPQNSMRYGVLFCFYL